LLRRRFVTGDVSLRRRFVKETLCVETFCMETFCRGDVLYVRRKASLSPLTSLGSCSPKKETTAWYETRVCVVYRYSLLLRSKPPDRPNVVPTPYLGPDPDTGLH
jgi:hypothetical protein